VTTGKDEEVNWPVNKMFMYELSNSYCSLAKDNQVMTLVINGE